MDSGIAITGNAQHHQLVVGRATSRGDGRHASVDELKPWARFKNTPAFWKNIRSQKAWPGSPVARHLIHGVNDALGDGM